MTNCRFRAFTADGKPVFFTLEDGPMRESRDTIKLCMRPEVGDLLNSTIVRAMDSCDLAEGDQVMVGGEPATIVYRGGFCCCSKRSGISTPITVYKEVTLVKQVTPADPAPITLLYDTEHFTIPDIKYCGPKGIRIKRLRKNIPIDEVYVDAGRSYEGHPVYFGKPTGLGTPIMRKGRVCWDGTPTYLENLTKEAGVAYGPY